MNNEVCLIILMSENGDEIVQSNIESFGNLEQLSKNIDLKKSGVFNQATQFSKVLQVNNTNPKFFKSSSSIRSKAKVLDDHSFENLNYSQVQPKKIMFNEKEKEFEKALKRETKRRKDPLKMLEIFIRKIQTFCRNLSKVDYV